MNKFRNIKTRGFDSKKESRRAQELSILQACGAISDLQFQVKFELLPKQDGERAVNYFADFTYLENGELVVEDVKSEMTRKLPAYILKRKMLLYFHKIKIKEI